ncbi:MAG: GAF domain-containing protein, partial [Psychromonas sp.]|nr:GAF domain-containing protein [Psychromonas sp.]
YRATQIETAANVANAASSFLDLNELLNSSVNLIRDRFELYYVGVFLVDKANKWAKLQAGTGKAGQIQLKKKHRLKIGGDSMIGWSIHHQKPRFALDVGREAVHFQNPNLPDTRSEMALPLISRNEVIGALTVQSTEQAAFSTDDITFLRTMANQLASAIENARLYEQAQQEIIDRKRIEDELRLSETKYRELVENANSIIIRINTQGCITFFNEFAQHFFGYTEKEILGKHIVGTIVPKIDTTGQNLAEILDNILQEPEKFTSNENENIRRNGERVWISWANKAIVDNKGNITEILCVGNDSTNRKMAEQETLKRNQELAVLNRVTTSLTSMLDLDSILQVTAREMVEAFKARNCGIALLNPNQTKLTVVTDYSASPDEPSVIELDIPIKNNPTASGVIETGKSLIVNNPQTSELTKPMHEVMRQRNTQSLMVIPLRVRAEVIGTIGIDTTNKDQVFTNEDLRLAETIAAQVAGAVENARLFEQTQATLVDRQQAQEELLKALERTESLYRIGDAVATITNKDAIYQTILAEYLRLINLKWGALALLHKTREYCTIHLIINETQPIQTDIKIPYNYPLFQHLLKTKQPLVIDNLHTHKLTKDNTAIKERLQIKSGLYVPVIVKSKVIGLVIAGSIEKSYSFSQSDIETGQAITDQLSIWLENRQLLAEAQYRSERLQTAAEVSRAASSILEVDTLIKDSVNFIRDRFGFYYVGLFMVDKAKKWAVLQAGTGEAGQIQLNKKHRLKIGGESMIGWSAKNRKARIALDVGEEAVRFKNPILPDTHSEMALPLTSRDEVIGALTVQSVERGAFSQEDVTLLQTMADQLANAIVNARLFKNAALAQQEAEARLQETSALQTLSQKLGGTLEIDDILNIFFEACTKEIGFEYTQLSLIDKQQHRIKAIGVFGTSASNIKQANRYLDSKDIIVNIITMGQTEIITSWDDRFDKETFEAESLASWVRVFTPITLRQENIGLVEAGVNKNTQVSVKDSQIRLLKAFINQTALALDNANRYEASQKRAKREALIKEITTKVRASTDLDTILKTTVKEIGDAVDNKRAYIHLVSSQETNRHNKHNPKVAD